MINNNADIFKQASELFHRRIQTREIEDETEVRDGVALLVTMQKSLVIDIMKLKLGVEYLPSESKTISNGKMFVKKIS
jgi:hypothetical protein